MSKLSILIASHNGGDVLKRTLEGYADIYIQNTNFELIIIDNASDDITADILKSYQGVLPLHTSYELRPGKNRALNHGLTMASGDLIVLSDDDAIPHRGFIEHWIGAFDAQPDMDILGGSIIPLFDTSPPEWMLSARPRFQELYAERQDVPAGPIEPDRIYGPNMAVRRCVFEAGLKFDEQIGPDASRKTTYAMGSETAFLMSAQKAGYRTGFAPVPTVSHIVRTHQISPGYISGRAYRMGRGTAAKHYANGVLQDTHAPALVRVAIAVRNSLISYSMRIKGHFGSAEERFNARWDAHFYRGYQDEMLARKAVPR